MDKKKQNRKNQAKNQYLKQILSDSHFRFLVTAALSGGWNLLYALYHLALAVGYRSYWFLTMGVYYLTACGMRALALRLWKSQDKAAEVGTTRKIGILMFFLAFVFIGIICLTIREKRNAVYHIILAISMAAYTFYCVVRAILNICHLKKKRDTQTILLRNISMAFALGSLFGLERMMLGTFCDAAESFTLKMEAASGAGFFVVIVLLGVNLLMLAKKKQAG